MDIIIRNERDADHRAVEELTREAFWNLYVPGCDEHYLVHMMRNHPEFIPELNFVAELDGVIVGNIMYTHSHLISNEGERVETITFGPVCVLPEYQHRGIGSALIRYSIDTARASGEKLVVISGHPHNYCKHGFKNCKDFNISDAEGKYPYGLLVLEMDEGALSGGPWKAHMSDVYDLNSEAVEAFDKHFEPKKKAYHHTQDEFSMAVRAYLE